MSVIFVTGRIGSGKSVFTKCLQDLGATVVDADKIVADLYEKNPQMVAEIEKVLGRSIRDHSGNVNKEIIAQQIFADDELRKNIERIIHPLVRKEMESSISKSNGVYVYEIPVVTADTDLKLATKIVVIDAPEELRRKRLIERGMHLADIDARIASQSRNQVQIKDAIYISNTSSLEDLKQAAHSIYLDVLDD